MMCGERKHVGQGNSKPYHQSPALTVSQVDCKSALQSSCQWQEKHALAVCAEACWRLAHLEAFIQVFIKL